MTLATAARHSMDSAEWYTPSFIIEAAREVMGGIDVDPASHEEANRLVKATRYYDEQMDGLVHPWDGSRVFINPPGKLVGQFWKKLWDEWRMGHFLQAIWVGYSLEQLQTLQSVERIGRIFHPMHFPMCVPAKRIPFVENAMKQEERVQKLIALGKNPNRTSAPSHANYITYLGVHVQRFAEVFENIGMVKL